MVPIPMLPRPPGMRLDLPRHIPQFARSSVKLIKAHDLTSPEQKALGRNRPLRI